MPDLVRLYSLARPLVRAWGRVTRGMTLGVRVVIVDGEGRVALVRHSYETGWHFPGGGVERGETAGFAARREAQEEAGCEPGRLTLIGLYDHGRHHSGDHVALYRAETWSACEPRPGPEIAERGWFAPEEAMAIAAPATGRRLAELFDGAEPDPYW